MRKLLLMIPVVLLSGNNIQAQKKANVITSDVKNFWNAYDKITAVKDTVQQYQYLKSLYLDKGTEGLKAIIKARNYTPQDYINAINNYPQFWASVRNNTLKADKMGAELDKGVGKLRKIYPDLKPARIYFTIGALRTGGTYGDGHVLIGSEIAMSDKNTVSSEFPPAMRKARRTYFDSNPINDLILLNIHEYVHTQQHPMGESLLTASISEGIAEFVSCKAMGVPSAAPAVGFGKKNADKVRARFELEMFYPPNLYRWLWGDAPNSFGVRDLGYYIGYQMAENHYNKIRDKKQAVKELINLNYADEKAVEDFVQKSGFFSASLNELRQRFENRRPEVIGIKQFSNNSRNVSVKTNEITVEFSEPLNGFNTGVDFGSLGKDSFPKNEIAKRFWSEDKKAWTIPVTLEPNKKYQLSVTENFRTADGLPLKPYLIEFETGNK